MNPLRRALLLSWLALAGGAGLAQVPPTQPGWPYPQQPTTQQPGAIPGTTQQPSPWGGTGLNWQEPQPYSGGYYNQGNMGRYGGRYGGLEGWRAQFESQWQVPQAPTFRGFPVYPSQLTGYGGYPGAGFPGLGQLPPAGLQALLGPLTGGPTLLPDAPPGWPLWVRTKDKEPLPFAPDLALLVRHSDRVWLQTSDEEPFVPLFFHDKLRTVRAGARVEVRQNGEFELLLHESSRLVARGVTTLRLVAMDTTSVQIELRQLTWVRVGASGRDNTILLPDGSSLWIKAPPAPEAPAAGPQPFLPQPIQTSAPLAGVTDVVIERQSDPGWFGGRATLTNLGATDVVYRHRGGEVVLPPLHRITLFLQPSDAPPGSELAVEGGTAEREGATAVCRTPAGGSATWSGARFQLPAGASVTFDPLLGDPFTPPAPAAEPKRP